MVETETQSVHDGEMNEMNEMMKWSHHVIHCVCCPWSHDLADPSALPPPSSPPPHHPHHIEVFRFP